MAEAFLPVTNEGYFIDLLTQEVTQNMYDAATTLATTFEGVTPVKLLQDRARKILAANPWLAARLCTHFETALPSLWVPHQPSFSPFFEYVEVSQVCSTGSDTNAVLREAHVTPMGEIYSGLYAKQGFKCLDVDEPLFKIRVCTGDDGKFILLVSMSHVLLDGATVHQLYQMLDPSYPVLSLEPERIQSIRKKLIQSKCLPGSCWLPRSEKVVNNDKHEWLMASNAARSTGELRAISGMSVDMEEDESKLSLDDFSGGMYRINTAWIKEQKSLFCGLDKDVPWVSSNDVVTSWYMNASRASAGMMVVNIRDRVPGLTSLHAGNYQGIFLFYPEEYASPVDIRRSVNLFSASCGKDCMAGPGESVAFISSVTRLNRDLNLGSECRLLMHFPLFPLELCVPTILDSVMILFSPRQGELAATFWTNKLDSFLDGPAVGESLDIFC
jgi:hypothetical protein